MRQSAASPIRTGLCAHVGLEIVIQLGIHHSPAMQALFEIGPLAPLDCLLSLLAGAVPLVGLELAKLIRRRRPSQSLAAAQA